MLRVASRIPIEPTCQEQPQQDTTHDLYVPFILHRFIERTASNAYLKKPGHYATGGGGLSEGGNPTQIVLARLCLPLLGALAVLV